jgi:hypothetical protein
MNPNVVARIEPIRLRNFIQQNRNIPDEDIIRIYIEQSVDWYVNKITSQLDPNIVAQIAPKVLNLYIKHNGKPSAQMLNRLINSTRMLGYHLPPPSSGASSSSAPLPPLTDTQINDMIIREMNPASVRFINPDLLRNYIQENRVTPKGEDLAMLNRQSRQRPRPSDLPTGRGYGGMLSIDEDDEEEGEEEEEEPIDLEELKEDIKNVKDDIRYTTDTVEHITKIIAELKHNLHIKQHYLLNEPTEMAKKKYLRKKLTKEIKSLTKEIAKQTDILDEWQKQLDERKTELERLITILRNHKSGSGLSSSKPEEYLPPNLISSLEEKEAEKEEWNTPIGEGNLILLEGAIWQRDNLFKKWADRNYVPTHSDLIDNHNQLMRLNNRIHYLEKITQKQPLISNQTINDAERKRLAMKQPEDLLEGEGFNKKQLRQIILDKNKVIADLEETAYGGAYCNTHYLDTILDNDTTSQNRVIHSYKSKPKYIKALSD